MKVIFQEHYGPITEEDITTFETAHNLRFPQDYRDFLKKYNGAFRPDREVIHYEIRGKRYGTFLNLLFGIKEQRGNSIPMQSDYSPPWNRFFPIGIDAGPNSFEMSLREADFGAIYFWENSQPFEINDEEKQSAFFIASSFTAFLDSLLTIKESKRIMSDNE